MIDTELRTLVEARLDAVVPPPGDLGRARSRGRRLRRRRTAARVAAGVAVVAVLGVAAGRLTVGDDGTAVDPNRFANVGALDFSAGLRAYADPGRTIHLGGRSFPAGRLDYLDTDAAATPYGVVFFDAGRPMLLGEDGHVTALAPGPVDDVAGFHPTAKADAVRPEVAYAVVRDGVASLAVRDLQQERTTARTELSCASSCADLVIEALDAGHVFVRIDGRTQVWDTDEDTFEPFAGPGTRVVDVRNGVVLYHGAAPDPASASGRTWRLVKAPVDAQLTFDGEHVLSWDRTLQPTAPDGEPLTLRLPGKADALSFFAMDTDGSILVAHQEGEYPSFVVYDCAVPSGTCTPLGGPIAFNGDPEFIGVDM